MKQSLSVPIVIGIAGVLFAYPATAQTTSRSLCKERAGEQPGPASENLRPAKSRA